jgi:hypothetical protein
LSDLTDEEIDLIERELVAVARDAGVDALPLSDRIRAHHASLRAERPKKRGTDQ